MCVFIPGFSHIKAQTKIWHSHWYPKHGETLVGFDVCEKSCNKLIYYILQPLIMYLQDPECFLPVARLFAIPLICYTVHI